MALNKWGQSVIKFKDRTETEKIAFVALAREVMSEISQQFETKSAVMYGALLGIVRDRELIQHDDDIDITFIAENKTRSEVSALGRSIALHFKSLGYEVWIISNGQFSVGKRSDGIFAVVDIFASWVEENAFFLNFAVAGEVSANAVLPLSTAYLYGKDLPAPAKPEVLLSAIYGPNWQRPDPNFKYQLPQQTINTHYFFHEGINDNRYYWDQYYERKQTREPWVEFPSQFALSVMPDLDGTERLLEIGCGNGRDTLYFAGTGLSILGADYSIKSIDYCRSKSAGLTTVGFEILNLYDEIQLDEFCERYSEQFDVIYNRFFLHAINIQGEQNLFHCASRVLKEGGRLYAEFRTDRDARMSAGTVLGATERNDGHYRRFINCEELVLRAEAAGFEVLYLVEGQGLARYRQEDPTVGRIIVRRRRSIN